MDVLRPDDTGRIQAKTISKALATAARLFLMGENSAQEILRAAQKVFESEKLVPQYLEMREAANLLSVPSDLKQTPGLLAVAQYIQTPTTPCRLIDNVVLSKDAFHKSIIDQLIAKTKIN